MKETVLEYLCKLSKESKARLTMHFAEEVEEISILISQIIQTLENYQKLNPVCDDNNPKQIAYGLMTKGANTIMASFEIALNGYFWEPPILFRNALEQFASAWDIVHNEARFVIWKNKKGFSSTDSVTNVKRAIEPIGQMYGLLSKMYVHISSINASPSCVLTDDEPKLQFFGFIRNGKENIRAGKIYISILITFICLQLTELTFHQYSLGLETIEKIPGTDNVRTKVSERHRKFVNIALQHFDTVVENPSVCF
ncbi:MAG TPA: hypothetical protein VJ624_03630 [Thermodesulfobacteriota bacterium]|nr:hypothetical protein [Thermodesulfobacteriota bacterium]